MKKINSYILNSPLFSALSDKYETTRFKVIGFIGYKNDYTMDQDFSNIKKQIKKHFNTQTHKQKVIDIGESIKAKQVLIDGLRDERAAAMRCVWLCFHLFKKGRPFSDHHELVSIC